MSWSGLAHYSFLGTRKPVARLPEATDSHESAIASLARCPPQRSTSFQNSVEK